MIQFIREGDREAEHGEVVVDIDDRVVGVDVTGWDAEHDGRDAAIGEVKRSGIGSAAASDGYLVRNVGELRRFNSELCETRIGYGAGIKKPDLHARAESSLGFCRMETGGIISGRPFEDDGDIRLSEVGKGFGASETDFLLDRSGKDEFVGVVHFSEDLGGLDGGSHADAVVKGLCHEQIGICHRREGGKWGDGCAELDVVIIRDLAAGGCSNVDEHRFDRNGAVPLGGWEKMNRLTADDAGDFFAVTIQDLDALAEYDLIPPSSDRDELDEAVWSDVLNHEADLIHVAGDEDARTFIGVHADDRAGFIRGERADFLEFIDENGTDFVFEA